MPSPRFDEFPFGFSWVVDETLERASHAIVDDDGGVWLIDPTDDPEALARAGALGTPKAVVQLLDRHDRACAQIAGRLGIPRHKAWLQPPGPPFEVVPVVSLPVWREVALWWPARRVLIVAESLGTARAWAPSAAPAGVHPMRRLLPPKGLGGYAPDHLLCGHGAGVHGTQAPSATREALARSVRDLPNLLRVLPSMLRR